MASFYPIKVLNTAVRTLPIKQGAQSADDMYGGGMTNINLAFGVSSYATWFRTGVRFPSFDLPDGATVVSAILRFRCHTSSTSALDVYIAGDLHADAAVWANTTDPTTGSPMNRLRTNNLVHWAFAANAQNWTAGSWYDSPDISPIVQEIADLSGDMTSKAIAFTLMVRDPNSDPPYLPTYSGSVAADSYRNVSSWDYSDHTYGPKLIVTYTLPQSDELVVLKVSAS